MGRRLRGRNEARTKEDEESTKDVGGKRIHNEGGERWDEFLDDKSFLR